MNMTDFNKKSRYNLDKKRKKKRFNKLNKNCKANQIVLLGDSITEFFDENLLNGKTSLEIYNRGISGDTSNRVLERLYENVISIAPAEVFLLIGTNDFDMGADCDYVFGNIKTIIENIKKELPDTKIVLECIFPVNPEIFSCANTRNEYIRETNERLKKYAADSDVTLLDMTGLLSDEKGNFGRAYSDDGLHPNDAGNRAIAEELSKLLIH